MIKAPGLDFSLSKCIQLLTLQKTLLTLSFKTKTVTEMSVTPTTQTSISGTKEELTDLLQTETKEQVQEYEGNVVPYISKEEWIMICSFKKHYFELVNVHV